MFVRFFSQRAQRQFLKKFSCDDAQVGTKYDVVIDDVSKPKAEYQTDGYFALDLLVAPAIMVNDEIVVEGGNVSEEEVEACICRHLGKCKAGRTEFTLINREVCMVKMLLFHSGNPA